MLCILSFISLDLLVKRSVSRTLLYKIAVQNSDSGRSHGQFRDKRQTKDTSYQTFEIHGLPTKVKIVRVDQEIWQVEKLRDKFLDISHVVF